MSESTTAATGWPTTAAELQFVGSAFAGTPEMFTVHEANHEADEVGDVGDSERTDPTTQHDEQRNRCESGSQ